MDKEEIRSTLRRLRPRVAREFQAELEGFFGSCAR